MYEDEFVFDDVVVVWLIVGRFFELGDWELCLVFGFGIVNWIFCIGEDLVVCFLRFGVIVVDF